MAEENKQLDKAFETLGQIDELLIDSDEEKK
jgi:hypothetical protein